MPMGTKPGAIHQGIKKEMPIAEHPFAKEQPKPMPIVEAPIKEMPIKEAPIKEAPKAPYIPKMPTPVIPEIDINNYYMMNMANMTVQQPTPPPPPQLPPSPQPPPAPVNILPEVKEVPKKEFPVFEAPVIEAPPPVMEQPVCEPECVPVTPIMPGSGFCPPLGYPMGAVMPYAEFPGAMPMPHGTIPAGPGIAPAVGGATYMPTHFEDESSSPFMPQMPFMNPVELSVGLFQPQGILFKHHMSSREWDQEGKCRQVINQYLIKGFQLQVAILQGDIRDSQRNSQVIHRKPIREIQPEEHTQAIRKHKEVIQAGGTYPCYPEVQGGYPTAGATRPFRNEGGYPGGTYPGYPEAQGGYPTGGAYPGNPEVQGGYPGGRTQYLRKFAGRSIPRLPATAGRLPGRSIRIPGRIPDPARSKRSLSKSCNGTRIWKPCSVPSIWANALRVSANGSRHTC